MARNPALPKPTPTDQLHTALRSNAGAAKIEALLARGADPNRPMADTRGGWARHHPMVWAATLMPWAAEPLLRHGAILNGRGRSTPSLLAQLILAPPADPAVAVGALACLLRLGADPDSPAPRGGGVLALAIEQGSDPRLVDALLAAGAHPDGPRASGPLDSDRMRLPIHMAADRGDMRSLRALAAAGADVGLLDGEGLDAPERASRAGHAQCQAQIEALMLRAQAALAPSRLGQVRL